MRKNLLFGTLMIIATLPLAACEAGNPLDLPEHELTADESLDLAATLVAQTYGAAADDAANGAGTQVAIVPMATTGIEFGRSLEVTLQCPQGGNVAISADVSGATYPDSNRIVIEMWGTKVHDGCGFKVRGEDVVVDGNPNITWYARFDAIDGVPNGVQELSLEGAFTWSTPHGRSGDCTVNLYVEYDPDAQQRTVSGTFCGIEIDNTTSWTLT